MHCLVLLTCEDLSLDKTGGWVPEVKIGTLLVQVILWSKGNNPKHCNQAWSIGSIHLSDTSMQHDLRGGVPSRERKW